jgi:hypothetical protein
MGVITEPAVTDRAASPSATKRDSSPRLLDVTCRRRRSPHRRTAEVAETAETAELRVTMSQDRSLPAPGLAEVRVTTASPDVAQMIAQALRSWFGSTEQRSYPAGDSGTGTRLVLTVDTTAVPEAPTPFQPWLVPAGGSGS